MPSPPGGPQLACDFFGLLDVVVRRAPKEQAARNSPDSDRNAQLRILKDAWSPGGSGADLSGGRQARTVNPWRRS
jgi:hypothetical protein